MRINALRQIEHLAPNEGSITVAVAITLIPFLKVPVGQFDLTPSSIGLHSLHLQDIFHLSPSGFRWIASGTHVCEELGAHIFNCQSIAFKRLGVSRFQGLLTPCEVFLTPTLFFNHILWNHSSTNWLISLCLLMSWEIRSKQKNMQGQ